MKETIPGIATGSVSGFIASISGTNISEAVLIAFLGGIAGYLGQFLIKLILTKLGLNKNKSK